MSNVKGRRRAIRRREQLPQRQGTGMEPGGFVTEVQGEQGVVNP